MTTAPPQASEELDHRAIMEVMVGILAALFTAMLSSTIVANALPTIIGDLDGTQAQYTWVVTSSLLAMTVSTPIWAKLSDLLKKFDKTFGATGKDYGKVTGDRSIGHGRAHLLGHGVRPRSWYAVPRPRWSGCPPSPSRRSRSASPKRRRGTAPVETS